MIVSRKTIGMLLPIFYRDYFDATSIDTEESMDGGAEVQCKVCKKTKTGKPGAVLALLHQIKHEVDCKNALNMAADLAKLRAKK